MKKKVTETSKISTMTLGDRPEPHMTLERLHEVAVGWRAEAQKLRAQLRSLRHSVEIAEQFAQEADDLIAGASGGNVIMFDRGRARRGSGVSR